MTLTLDKDGERLDSALSRLVPELTRSQAQRLIEQGAVTRDGRPVKKNEKLPAGTTLELAIPEVRETPIAAQEIPLEVCYEDADVIVVNKPKGLVVHPAPVMQTARSSTHCWHTAAILCPASVGKSGPASSTASTKTHPASSSQPRTTSRTPRLPRS